MRVEFTYVPFPIFEPVHLSTAREKAIIGAVGAGKTIAMCADGIGTMLDQPGSRGGIFRQSVPSLRDTTELEFINLLAMPPADEEAWEEGRIKTLWDVIKENDGLRREAGHIRSITFPNGSEMHFQSLDKWTKHMGRNMAWIGIDESSEITVESYLALLTRLRQQDPLPGARRLGLDLSMWKSPRQTIVNASNPDGHNWVWQYFVNQRPTRKQVREGTYRRAFRSTSFDNPTFFDEDGNPNQYLLSLLTMPELWVRRYVLALGSDEPVLTPRGWVAIRELSVGDTVTGSDGKPIKVVAAHPQGERPLFRVTLSDGASVTCDANHRWTVGRRDQSRTHYGDLRWVTVPTSELRFGSHRDRLPLLSPVEYDVVPSLPIDPYMLGALLGDGTWSERQVELADQEGHVSAQFEHSLGDRFRRRNSGLGAWIRDPDASLRGALRALGLMGTKARTKFVPELYLRASPGERLSVLQGLMDTDGYAGVSGNSYTTISPHLADNVVELARSLGIRARRSGPGARRRYAVRLTPPVGVEIFRTPRKREAAHHSVNGTYRYVAAVEPVAAGDATCITVDSPDGLFVTRDFIVTHNCEFDTFEGQILPFDRNKHTYPYFEPPEEWERAMGFDWGMRNPAAASWWARKPGTTKWHKYREWMSHNPMNDTEKQLAITMTVHQVATAIRRLEVVNGKRENIRWRVADPAIKQRTADEGKSVFYWMTTHGLNFQLGMKDYSSRINAQIQLLVSDDLVIADTLDMTIAQYEQYRWSKLSVTRETDGPERPHKKDDHLVDSDQYLATIFVANAKIPQPLKPLTFDDEVWRQVKKQVMRNHQRWRRAGIV